MLSTVISQVYNHFGTAFLSPHYIHIGYRRLFPACLYIQTKGTKKQLPQNNVLLVVGCISMRTITCFDCMYVGVKKSIYRERG